MCVLPMAGVRSTGPIWHELHWHRAAGLHCFVPSRHYERWQVAALPAFVSVNANHFIERLRCCSAVAALLAQKNAIANWDELAAGLGLVGWTVTDPVCSWTGVECTENGAIVRM
jgi:hypothetical protein